MKNLLVLFIVIASPAFACEACFGAPGHAQTNGMNAAILTLLGCTMAVLGCMAALIVQVAWRARAAASMQAPPAAEGDLA